jgi:hypothetical protein
MMTDALDRTDGKNQGIHAADAQPRSDGVGNIRTPEGGMHQSRNQIMERASGSPILDQEVAVPILEVVEEPGSVYEDRHI